MDLLDEELPPPSTSSSDAAVVEVSEVHFQLNSRIRISRTCRMNWFIDNRFINFSLDAFDIGDRDFVIYGAEAADGTPLAKNALLHMTPTTKALFFAGIYKKSIVLDLSPGCFAADDCGEILYTNMLPALRKLLVELLTPFKHANNTVVHHPKVCITLIAYTPFVNFQHPPVLIHGAWVTLANIEQFLAKTEAYVRKFIDDLDIFMHPINARREASEAACYRMKLSDVNDASPVHDDFPLNDKVSIDFRLIQMIRLGMLGLQIAPKSAHANILIVTDGVLYIPDQAVVQSIAISLRASGVAVSFLQVTTKNTTGCLGLVPSSDMLCFLAKVSFGTHFNHEQVYASDFVSPENGILEHPTRFQKDFLAWSCQRDPYEMEPPLPMYAKDLLPRSSRSTKLKCDFFMLFHVRLREGYTLRSLSLHTHDSKQYISASFTLPWSVDARIEYKISTLYADTEKDDLQAISQEVGIVTNYLPTQDKKDNSLLAALFVRESELFAIKMIGFRFNPKHYETEHLPLHRYPGVYVFLTRNRPFPTLAIKNLENSLFNTFWQPLIIADINALSRCCDVATHRFSMPYFVDEANVVNFWPDMDSPYVPGILKPKLMEAVYAYFAKTTTFCLAAKLSWVKVIRDEAGKVPPNACYFIRVHSDSTLLSVQIVFVGDWCIEERNRVSNKIRRELKELQDFEGLLISLAVGTDGKLIRYRQVPPLFGAIMPPGISSPTEPCWSTRLKIHQQALSRFLIPHRHIYKVEKDFDDYSFGQVALEGMNFIVARRRMDGYRIGFRAGAITNFIREVICEQDDIDKSINLAQRGSRLDQCIIFPPIKEPIVLKGASVQQLREHLHVVGKSLVIQDAILSVDNSPDTSTKLASSDETLKAPNPEAVPGPSILKKSDESCCTPVAVVEGLEVLTGVVDDWSTGVSLHRRGSQSTPDRITLLESTGLKSVEKPKPAKPAKRKHHKKGKKHILPKVRERQSSENSETLLAMYAPNDDPTPQDNEISDPGPPPDPLPALPDPLPTRENVPEEYLEKGCFIVTEYWTEPTESGELPAGDVAKTIEEDQAMLSALVTFRAMQVELDRAPGIGTALLGAEPYSTRVKPCPAVDIAPNVSYHPHLYNVVKMCRCGERRLMLFPTLKYVFTDKDRNSRLGRILDSFNRELRSYMSQYFDFEDHDGAWATLAAGLEDELKFIDEVELEKAQAALKAAEAPKVVEPPKIVESETDNEQTADDSAETGTPTGYDSAGSNATGSNASAPRPRKVNEAAELLASLDMDALTKQILGEHTAPRKNAGSKTSTNSPKSMDGSVSSSMAPAGLQDDDDDNDAPYLPTVKKSGKSLNHKKLVQKLSSVSGNQNDSSAETASTQVENKKKRRKKKKSGGASRNASFTSFDRESIRSGKRLPEEQIDLAPLAFSVYYKRRDPKTVIVVIVPATCRAVIAITNSQVPRLPVLAFMIEEDRLLNIFQKTRSLPKEFPHRSVMNFCALSTLSALNLQVNAKSKEPNLSPGSGSPFERSTASDYDPEFTDLTDFCGNVVHELLFSRAYAHAAYTCLGINVAVPQVVLKEVLEERCLQTSVNVNSIQDVLRVTCTHLSSYLQSKRCSRYRRHQMPNVAAYSDISSASDSDIEVQQIMNPFRYSESENDEICRMERMEFTHAFESVLKRHKFYKVPNFGEYYFYWPKKRPKPEEDDKDGENKDGKPGEKKDGPLDKKKEEKKVEKKEPKKKKKPGEDYESGTDKTNQSDSSDEESDFDDSFEVDMQPLFLQFYVDLEKFGDKLNSYPVGFIPNCLKEVMNSGPGPDGLSEEEKSHLDEFDVKMEMFVLTVPGMVSNDVCFDETLFRVEDDQFDFDLRLQDFEDDNKRPSLDLPKREIDVILKLCDGIRHMLETEKILILSRYFDTQKSYRNITRVMRFVQKEAKQVDERTQVQMAANDTLFVINEQEGMRRLAKRLEGATFSYCRIQCVKDEHSKHRDKPAMVFYCCSVDDFDAFCKEHSANAKLVKFDFVPKKKPRRGRNDTLVENGIDEDDNTTATDEITGSSTIIQKSSSDAQEVEESKSDDENSLAGVEEVPEIDEKGDKEVAEDVESNPDLDEKVKRKQIVHDFWLLAKFDSNYVRSYFFQRPSGVHMNLFNKFTAKLQAEIKLVNQGLLLEDMYEKGEALPYLIREDVPTSPKSTVEPEPDPVQYPERPQLTAYAQRYAYRPSESNSSEATDDVFSTNIADNNGEREDLISDTDASSNLRAKYQFGYFACPKVWHHWFGINPRLRREPNVGVMALMDELENLQLLNRKNVYKVKDEHGNIFYMSLFNDLASVQNAMPTENEKFIEEVKQRIESSVVLVIFGIATPSTDITQQLMKQLQKRLDARVLEELQSAVYKNPQLGLEPTDVSFLQHNPDAPAETFFYSLPNIASEYLASVHTYLEQHLAAYFITPRYVESSVTRCDSVDYYTPLVISNCTRQHRLPGSNFEHFPVDGIDKGPMPEHYEPLIFVVNKPKKEGQRTSGMGCFEVRLVDRRGKVVDSHNSEAYLPGKLGSDSFSLLYPGFSGAKPFSRSNKFQDQTKCTLVESLETDANFIASEHFVAFYVWQAGDIGLQELKTRLRILCQQAMADVVFEFGVLSQPILEPVPPPASPEELALCASPLNRQNSDNTRTPLNKRNSDAASCLQTVPSNLSLPRPSAPTTPVTADKANNFIVPPTVFAVDTPPPYGAPQKTRLLMSTGWASVANQGYHRIGYKPPISRIDEVPKVTQFSTWIPPSVKNAPEMLRQDFVDSLNNFFNFMSRESQRYPEMSQSFSKTRFVLDSERLAPAVLRVIYAKFVATFENDHVVILKQLYTPTSHRLETMTDFTPLMHNPLIYDKGHAVDMKDDFRVLDYVVIVQSKVQMSQTIQVSQSGGVPTPEIEKVIKDPRKAHLKFGPKAEPFVPRRRLLFVTIKGEILTLFQYNMEAEIMQTVTDIVERTVFWNNARCRLLREIGLHKMRVSHLTTLVSGDARDELYQPLKWRDPQILVSHDYPPDSFRPADYPNPPKDLSSKFLRLYRLSNPDFVLKHNSASKFDDQITQFLALRQDIRDDVTKIIDLKEAHSTFLAGMGGESVLLEDDILFRIMDRVQEAHYVETPVLLFPEWRKKVAAIRGSTTVEHGSVSRRRQKQSTPTKNPVRKKVSLEAKMKPRSQTVTQSMLPALCRTNSTDEASTLRLQAQLLSEYTHYLCHHLNAVLIKLPSKLAGSPHSPKGSGTPVNWLVVATSAGFVLLHLSFVEPYFCLRVLTWDKSQIKLPVSDGDLHNLICVKNSIVSRCHLHSFTYDFHLRIMSNYLMEQGEAPFSRGYNTSAFLIDFLQYYTCRPPSARNCIFEENCVFKDNLKVPGSSVWEDFLKNDHKYLWKVVKLKVSEKEDADEYMLVSSNEKLAANYAVIRLVTNTTPASKARENELYLRYYVLMVAEDVGIVEASGIPTEESAFRLVDQVPEVNDTDDDIVVEGELAYDSSGSSDHGALFKRNKLRSSAQSITSGTTSVSERLSDLDTSCLTENNSGCPSPGSTGGTLIDDNMTPQLSSTFTARDLPKRPKGSATQIHREPPRGHRKKTSGTYTDSVRLLGQIPREQVTYVQYVNSFQTSVQNELVKIADNIKGMLKRAVGTADHSCYVEHLWRKMLSSRPVEPNRGALSLLQRLDGTVDPPLKQVASTELTSSEWETFLSLIRRDPMEVSDPRVLTCLAGVNHLQLFRFFIEHFGGGRCRFFEFPHSKNLIIVNCLYLENATLIEHRDNRLSMAFLYKTSDISANNATFVSDWVTKQFDEVMRCLSAFVWTDLMATRPTHTR
uniref:VWFA domain-containing protein n=1 Tax=Panagrellus redivivus TaxID=6233 RepID=A0A7E4VP94_PANRE